MTIADLKQRQQALDPGQSFAVSAPAGSGKTELLTQRVLTLLAQVNSPEEILCLTFTRKAAGEMQQRITSALQLAEADTPPSQAHARQTWELAKAALKQDKQQGWQLLQSPNRLRIQTIDGFCRNLAQQLSVDSGFSDMTEPLEQPQTHYQQAVAELLLTELQKDGPLGDAIATLLRHLDNNLNKLEALLIGLLAKREQWLQHLISARDARPYLEHFLQQTISETLQTLAQQLQPVASDLCLLADYAASNLIARNKESAITTCLGLTELPDYHDENLPQWQGLVDLLITTSESNPDWRSDRGINIKLGFPTGKDDPELGDIRKAGIKELLGWCRQQDGLLETLLDVRYLPCAHYPDSQWQTLDALTQLLPALAAQLQLHFQQQNCCDFTEVTLAALRALGDEDNPTDLALKLDYQIQHILIDEFQDTSSVQFRILSLLTQGWQPDDGRTLFIVGDGMQSLYGFRNANVGLFLEARSQPINNIRLKPLDLQVNFRSQAGVIDWVNEVFADAFPSRDNISRGAVRYSSATAFHPELEGEAVTIDAFMDYPDAASQEATQVVELVNQAKQQNPDGSIAILVRNRSHLKEILPALYNAGHSWQATDIDPLAKRMPVIDLMSLTRALLSPADRIAWLSVLRAPWCGLDLHDLYHLTNTPLAENPAAPGQYPLLIGQLQHHQSIDKISDSGQQILNRVAAILIPAWQQRQRKPLRCLVEGVWLTLGGLAALRHPSDIEHCQQYLNLLEQQAPIKDWAVFEQAVSKLYAAPNPDADKQLQIMTIHKAKGLEFDTVIMPGLNRSGSSDSQQLLLWRERIAQNGQQQLLISPLQASGEERDPLYRHLQQEAKEKNRLENTRVIYVGATRAIQKLHLLFSIKEGKKPASNTLLNRIWPWVENAITEESPVVKLHRCAETKAVGETSEQEIPRFTHIQRLPIGWQFDADLPQPITIEHNSTTPQLEGNADARYIGTVLHRILRQITLEGVDSWHTKTIKLRQPFWAIQLQQLGTIETQPALDVLKQSVEKTLADPQAQWILNNKHQDSQCEYELGYLDNSQQPRTAIVDRTFVDQDFRWIIDYKSSQPEEGETLEQFLERQKNSYRQQLELYMNIYQQLEDLPVKTALYFPIIGRLEVYSP